jgi:hypothetical protein
MGAAPRPFALVIPTLAEVETWTDKQAYDFLSSWKAAAGTQAEYDAEFDAADPAVVQAVVLKASHIVQLPSTVDKLWMWLEGKNFFPNTLTPNPLGMRNWMLAGVAGLGILYLMFKSKAGG